MRIFSRRGYRFISLDDAMEMLQGHKPMQPYSMVLTFDDGYRNNITHALPILRRYNAPATFFVPTGFLDNPRPFWWDRLDYALQQCNVHGRKVKVGSFAMILDSSSRPALQESYKRLRRIAKKQQMSDHDFVQDMDQLAVQLEQESGRALSNIQKDDDWSAIMTWEQIEQYAGNDVTFGSHTVEHIRLGLVNAEIAFDQLVRSKQHIEDRTGKRCMSICCPNGSHSDETTAIAREYGYVCQFTGEQGLNHMGDDLMMLKRISLPVDMSGTELVAKVACRGRV